MASLFFNRFAPAPLCASRRAGTLVETLVAAALASIGIAGFCVANANCVGIVRAHRESLAATEHLQQRLEQLRAANWSDLTSSASLRTLLSGNALIGGTFCPSSERLTVSPYPAVSPAVDPIVITRAANGTTTVLTAPPGSFNLRNAAAVRIDYQTTWTSAQGRRVHLRESSCVICAGGLLR